MTFADLRRLLRSPMSVAITSAVLAFVFWTFFGGKMPAGGDFERARATIAASTLIHDRELATVTSIEDGDTITVDLHGKKEKIRFLGIDTPELQHGKRLRECFGDEAKVHLTELLAGHPVLLMADATQGDRDRYDRLLRYVELDDETDINEAMIAEGFAYEYTYDLPYQRQAAYRHAEAEAKKSLRGLWSVDACNGERLPPAFLL